MEKKNLITLLALFFIFTRTLHADFDFSMKADDANKILTNYYQQILSDQIPEDQIKKITSGGGGYIQFALDWFTSFTTKKNIKHLSDEDIQKIQQSLAEKIAIYHYLFNAYNGIFNPSNSLQQVQPITDTELQKVLDVWTNKDLLAALTLVDKKTKKSNGTVVNHYFNHIIDVVKANLEKNYTASTPETILQKIITEWSQLPQENKKLLVKALQEKPDNSLVKRLAQNILPENVYALIRKGFNDNKNKPLEQKPYIFLAELVDVLFKKPKSVPLKDAVLLYLNPKNASKRTYKDLIEEMDKDPNFFYVTFGTVGDANMITQWFHEARLGKKKKVVDDKATKDYEDKTGRKKIIYKDVLVEKDGIMVPEREPADPDLKQFLEKVIEYNPILYVQKSSILRDTYVPAEDRVENLANAFKAFV